jgi:hypothetical protein
MGIDAHALTENRSGIVKDLQVSEANGHTRWPRGGYEASQKVRKRIEQVFGWLKTIGGLRKTRYKGRAKIQLYAFMAGAAYNLLRPTKLIERSA